MNLHTQTELHAIPGSIKINENGTQRFGVFWGITSVIDVKKARQSIGYVAQSTYFENRLTLTTSNKVRSLSQ